MFNNVWLKLAAFSLTAIVIAFVVLWGISQFSGYNYYNNTNSMMYRNGMYMQGNINDNVNTPRMNMNGNMNMQGGMGMMQGGMGMMQGGMGMQNGGNMQGGMGMQNGGNMQGGMGMQNGGNMQGGMGMMDDDM